MCKTNALHPISAKNYHCLTIIFTITKKKFFLDKKNPRRSGDCTLRTLLLFSFGLLGLSGLGLGLGLGLKFFAGIGESFFKWVGLGLGLS